MSFFIEIITRAIKHFSVMKNTNYHFMGMDVNIFFCKTISHVLLVFCISLPTLSLSATKVINGCALVKGSSCVNVNLAGKNLKGLNLSGADLRGADLTGANLMGANLSGAKLKQAVLTRTNLARARLTSANLSYATLSSAIMKDLIAVRANFYGANLTNAILINADLRFSDLSATNMGGAITRRAKLGGVVYTGVDPGKDNLGSNLPSSPSTEPTIKKFSVSSPDFSDGGIYPKKFDCALNGGMDLSPELSWSNPPEGTKSFVITISDKDVPVSTPKGLFFGSVTMWGVYGIPSSVTSIPQGYSVSHPPDIKDTTNYSNNLFGYKSSCPGHPKYPGDASGSVKKDRRIKIVVFALNYIPTVGDFAPSKTTGWGTSALDNASLMGCILGEINCPANPSVLETASITPILISQ